MANRENIPSIVTTRQIDYGALVRKQWGGEWGKPEKVYEFSNGRKFDETSQRGGSFYQPTE